MTPVLEAAAIRNLLPHRYPFLLVDRVLEIVKHERLIAIKNVTTNEPFFTGHFPEQPVMPGVLIIEALAQAAGILLLESAELKERKIYFLVGVDKARFKKVVQPGDQLILEIQALQLRKKYGKFATQAKVNDQIACVAEITVLQDDSQ